MLMTLGWEKYQKENFASKQSFLKNLKKKWDYTNNEEVKTKIEEMKNINTKGILFIFGTEFKNGRLV